MKHKFLALLTVLLVGVASAAFVAHSADAPDPDKDAKLLATKAQELAKAKNWDQAIALMHKAIALAPDSDPLFGILSEFELKASKWGDGLKHAQKAIALNPANGQYYLLAAAHAYGEQELERARDYCKIVLADPKKFGPASVQQARVVEDLLVDKTFTLFYKLDPKKGRLTGGAFAIALPKTGLPYQDTTYEIGGVKSHRLAKGQADDVLHVTPQGREPFPLTIKVFVKPHSFKEALAKAALAKAVKKPLPPEATAHLGPMLGIDPKSPVLRKTLSGLKGTDTVATVRNIQAWLNKNIEYKLEGASFLEVDFKSVDEIVKRGHAECRGYALLFTALCRAADIPARPVWGMVRVPPGVERKHGDIISHSWAEFYVAGVGWVPVDPQRPETFGFLPNYYLRMFSGAQRTANSPEVLPLLNLLGMHDAKMKVDEAR